MGSAAYTINLPAAATPTFSPVAGTYVGAQSVTISDTTNGAAIYYTTNGTTPTTSSTPYSGSITVSTSETVEAIAAATGYSNSAVGSAAYTINSTLYSYSIPGYVLGSNPTGYDADGNIIGYTDSVTGTWGTNVYDQLNRLTSASATAGTYAGLLEAWSYDAFGNRTSENFSGSYGGSIPGDSTTSFNSNNQISSTTLGTILYDASGDVTQDNQNQYLYNGDGHLCAVKNISSGAMYGYIFGADGTRVSTGTISTWGSCDPTVNGYKATKDSLLDPSGGQLTETNVSTSGVITWAHTNVWLGGHLMATYDATGLHDYLSDWQGSRRVQTNYLGEVEKTCTNLPYGEGETCSPSPTEDLYAGLSEDSESDLDHAMNRQFAPVLGGWTTPDPNNGSYNIYDPQSMNRYIFVHDDPFGSTDPSGLDGCTEVSNYIYGTLINCGFTLYVEAWGSYMPLTAAEAAPWAAIAPGIGILIGAAELVYDLGEASGWWGGSPFHGNVDASQSGKNVLQNPNCPGKIQSQLTKALINGALIGPGQIAQAIAWKFGHVVLVGIDAALSAKLPFLNLGGTVHGTLSIAYDPTGSTALVVTSGAGFTTAGADVGVTGQFTFLSDKSIFALTSEPQQTFSFAGGDGLQVGGSFDMTGSTSINIGAGSGATVNSTTDVSSSYILSCSQSVFE